MSLKRSGAASAYARRFTDDVEWSCEDGSRSDHDFLCRCVEAAITSGATTINIPDTVGYAGPGGVRGAHHHAAQPRAQHRQGDDFGPLSQRPGVGGRQLVGGGQGGRSADRVHRQRHRRAGRQRGDGRNRDGAETRHDRMPYTTGVRTENIIRASRLVSAITGMVVQPNKAIIGANAFAHESGIHQDGFLKHAATYEIMTPESVGLTTSKIVLGKLSGRHAFREKLKELGYELGDNLSPMRSAGSRILLTAKRRSLTKTSSLWLTMRSCAPTTASIWCRWRLRAAPESRAQRSSSPLTEKRAVASPGVMALLMRHSNASKTLSQPTLDSSSTKYAPSRTALTHKRSSPSGLRKMG
jgi:hypothetical protein